MPFNPNEHRPVDLEEAINLISRSLDENEKKYLRTNGWIGLHHGAGTKLRNAWLWNSEHPLHQFFRETYGLGHADDMSGLILEGVTCSLQGKPHDIQAQVASYRAHWAREGVDPLRAAE